MTLSSCVLHFITLCYTKCGTLLPLLKLGTYIDLKKKNHWAQSATLSERVQMCAMGFLKFSLGHKAETHSTFKCLYSSLLIRLNSLASRLFSLLNRILKLHNNDWIFNLGLIKAIDLTGYNE